MKILFVLPLRTDWGIRYSPGIASMSAVLKSRGYETLVLITERVDEVKQEVEKVRPDILAISSTIVDFKFSCQIAKEIKQLDQKTFIICGGIQCILDPDESILTGWFDAVCIQEGEYPLLELVRSIESGDNKTDIKGLWFWNGGLIIRNELRKPVNLERIPDPDREIFSEQNADYYRGEMFLRPGEKGGIFQLSRGCLFNCSYCSASALRKHLGGNLYYRSLSPKRAVSQIVKAQKKYNYDYIFFADDTFTLDNRWAVEFLELYRKKVGLPFHCQLRLNTFNEKMVELLSNSNCDSVAFGVESGDVKLRTQVLNRMITNGEIYQAAKWLRKYSIRICTYNMVGLPGESPLKFVKTILINRVIKPDMLYIFIFYPYKGTQLYEMCLNEGYLLLSKEVNDLNHRSESILKLPTFKKVDIEYYYSNFYKILSISRIGLLGTIKFYLSLIPPSSGFSRWTRKVADM